MALPQRQLSLEQFLRLPEEEPALEFEAGRITQKVAPKGRHSRLQTRLSELLNRFAEPPKLAVAFAELRTTFGGRSYVPDLAVYRWERIPRTPDGEVADVFEAPPDIAVEIVSPGQSATTLVRRCLWYVANGVQIALLVDPDDASVLLFRPGQVPRALHDSDRIDVGDVLPGFDLTVRDLLGSLRL
jgi:Uma2 family endonuclease